MEKNLLQEALATLSPAEIREFGKFVRSPFFNTRQQLVNLFDQMVAKQPAAPKIKNIAHPIVPDETLPMPAISGVEARLANSALLALLEKYWMYCEKFEDGERAKIRLSALYRKRNLPKHFRITLREARQSRERRPWRHADYYHDLHLIEWEQYQYDTAVRRTEFLNLQATSDLMDTAFIARKLRLACLARSHHAWTGRRARLPSQVKLNWQPVVRSAPWKTTPHTVLGKAGWRTRLSTTCATARCPSSPSLAAS